MSMKYEKNVKLLYAGSKPSTEIHVRCRCSSWTSQQCRVHTTQPTTNAASPCCWPEVVTLFEQTNPTFCRPVHLSMAIIHNSVKLLRNDSSIDLAWAVVVCPGVTGTLHRVEKLWALGARARAVELRLNTHVFNVSAVYFFQFPKKSRLYTLERRVRTPQQPAVTINDVDMSTDCTLTKSTHALGIYDIVYRAQTSFNSAIGTTVYPMRYSNSGT